MSNILSLNKIREKKEMQDLEKIALNPFDSNSKFNFSLSSLGISALLFIDSYLYPSQTDLDFYSKLERQFSLSQVMTYDFFYYEKNLSYKYPWFYNEYLSKIEEKFLVTKLAINIDYFNFMINKFENQEFNGTAILDEAITLYLQVFYNQINSIEDFNLFPKIKDTKKNAMSSKNGELIKILNEIQRGKKLEFLPSNDNIKKSKISIFYGKV